MVLDGKNHVEGVNFAALLPAAEAGDIAAVRRLAAARPDLLNPDHAEFRDSALHRAVLRRNELVRLYLERGAEVLEADAEPWATPLAWATKHRHHAVVELLRSDATWEIESVDSSIGARGQGGKGWTSEARARSDRR